MADRAGGHPLQRQRLGGSYPRAAAFPVIKRFDTYDFSALPGLPKQKVLELARGEWIEQRYDCGLIGNAGPGKTRLATALGLAV